MPSRTLALPPTEPLQELATELAQALASEARPKVKKAGTRLLAFLAASYEVAPPKLSVLGARPKKVSEGSSYELWGDYTFATEVIRVWMRTAVLGKVTSYRGLLNTILHEFCHHLDVKRFGWPDTPHTRGFFGRIDDLYHLALATPPDQRRPLVWIKGRNTWRIDWTKLRAKPASPRRAEELSRNWTGLQQPSQRLGRRWGEVREFTSRTRGGPRPAHSKCSRRGH